MNCFESWCFGIRIHDVQHAQSNIKEAALIPTLWPLTPQSTKSYHAPQVMEASHGSPDGSKTETAHP